MRLFEFRKKEENKKKRVKILLFIWLMR